MVALSASLVSVCSVRYSALERRRREAGID